MHRTLKQMEFPAMLLWFFFCLPHTATAQRPPLPFKGKSIWVIEQGKEPYTIPYDGATSLPGLSVYYGVIRNTDGSPAVRAGFYAQVTPVVKSDGPVQTQSVGVPMSAGPDGQFQFALKAYRSDGIFMMGSDGDGIFKRSQERFSLAEGTQNIIVSRMKADLPAHLIKANGQAIDFNSTPTYTLGTFPAWN